MLALECTAETLEVLELRGLESIALALLQRAGGSDPHAPSAFSFHLNLLYTHGLDAQAVERLRAYRLAVPDSPTHANYAAILSNQSAPTLRQRPDDQRAGRADARGHPNRDASRHAPAHRTPRPRLSSKRRRSRQRTATSGTTSARHSSSRAK